MPPWLWQSLAISKGGVPLTPPRDGREVRCQRTPRPVAWACGQTGVEQCPIRVTGRTPAAGNTGGAPDGELGRRGAELCAQHMVGVRTQCRGRLGGPASLRETRIGLATIRISPIVWCVAVVMSRRARTCGSVIRSASWLIGP